MSIRSLLKDPDRRSYGAWAEADPFTEEDALQEAQLQDVRFDVLRARAYLLFDCRGALQIRAGNTAVLVAGGVEKFCWSGRPAGRRAAWPVVGWEPRIVGERWAVAAYYVDAVSELVAASAEFYVGDVPGCDDAQPDYGDATEEEMAAGLAGWDSDFELVHAMFLAPYRNWRNFSTSCDAGPAWLRRIRLHDG